MTSKDAAATIEDIQRDVQALRDDMGRLAGQVTELLSTGGGEALEKIKERVNRMHGDLDETLSGVGERGREALTDVTDHLSEALQESLQEHPVTTVALAVGLGFLFGTAWRR
ncbi:MAG TPA: hypothetical protein VE909_12335 [Xanthobacteraceae bacterium]|nr:hypothetical protein [Xanthobacteraceae bacterium]